MPTEKIGDTVTVQTAGHPPRTDSPEYIASRKWLMSVIHGGCYICGGPVDMKHAEAPADSHGLQDHHGGGLNIGDVLVGFNLIGTEWSLGWAADPSRVTAFVQQMIDANLISPEAFAAEGLALPLADTAAVMKWVDSKFNANVKICAPHHVGHQQQHTPDANGHEAVGVHNIPFPIWLGQATCDWERFDMWGGSTGTIAVSPHPTKPGHVVVQHVDASHGTLHASGRRLAIGDVLPPTHPHARAAHAGAGKKHT